MRVTAAIVKEQGVSFAVVSVKQAAAQPGRRDEVQAGMGSIFPGVPIVLMSQDARGRASYYGRSDLVRWLSNLFVEQLPWKEYESAA